MVPQEAYELPEGKAAVVNEGKDLSIITYGMGVHWAIEIKDQFPNHSIEIIDLRTLVPLDWETVFSSVKKCNKAIVLQEDSGSFGVASELVSRIQEECFYQLDAPVVKLGSLDTPVPFAKTLENGFLANARLKEKVELLLQS